MAMSLAAGACGDGAVRLAFRPSPGDRFTYEITVHSTTSTRVDGVDDRDADERIVLRAEHEVLRAGPQGSTVRVRLREVSDPGGTTRTFEVRLDRSAQLSAVERVEGLPAEVLGDLGLSEIFPAAAAAAPDRPLQPGGRWEIDDTVDLPGLEGAHLTGTGRLSRLGVEDGRDLATVRTDVELPVRRSLEVAGTRLRLRGTQRTEATTTYALGDGAVERSTATTRASFTVLLHPVAGDGAPTSGTLRVEVRSESRRLRSR